MMRIEQILMAILLLGTFTCCSRQEMSVEEISNIYAERLSKKYRNTEYLMVIRYMALNGQFEDSNHDIVLKACKYLKYSLLPSTKAKSYKHVITNNLLNNAYSANREIRDICSEILFDLYPDLKEIYGNHINYMEIINSEFRNITWVPGKWAYSKDKAIGVRLSINKKKQFQHDRIFALIEVMNCTTKILSIEMIERSSGLHGKHVKSKGPSSVVFNTKQISWRPSEPIINIKPGEILSKSIRQEKMFILPGLKTGEYELNFSYKSRIKSLYRKYKNKIYWEGECDKCLVIFNVIPSK